MLAVLDWLVEGDRENKPYTVQNRVKGTRGDVNP